MDIEKSIYALYECEATAKEMLYGFRKCSERIPGQYADVHDANVFINV